ncbi:unnamed protein product, partial [Prorocentrum cordatum]
METYVQSYTSQRSQLTESIRMHNRPSAIAGRERRKIIARGRLGFEVLRSFLKRRFGKALRAWRAVDQSGRLAIGEAEFYRACDKVGFQPPKLVGLRDVWQYIDQDTNGLFDFCEFSPEVAGELMHFKLWVDQRFGAGMAGIRRMIKRMDANKSGAVSEKEFVDTCERNSPGYDLGRVKASKIFGHLDFENKGMLTMEQLEVLQTWRPPMHRLGQANPAALETLRAQLREYHGDSELRAWRYG